MQPQPSLSPVLEQDRATFIWNGKNPPGLIGDFNDWKEEEAIPFQKTGRGQWSVTLELPPDAYVEYGYIRQGERIPDPGNPNRIFNGVSTYNHFFYMPAGQPTPLTRRGKGVAAGQVTRHQVTGQLILSGRAEPLDLYSRSVYLYHPAAPGPYPLLVVYDGRDYLRRARLNLIIDQLVAAGRIQPLALALVPNGGRYRSIEYSCNDSTLAFLLSGVLPLARRELDVIDIERQPGAFGILGASMGGLTSLYTGLRFPHIFGKVLSQSGAFDDEFVVYDLVRGLARRPLQVWMDVGVLEYLHPANVEMRQALDQAGYPVQYKEFAGGHNYTCWRNDIEHGLEALFPPERPGKG